MQRAKEGWLCRCLLGVAVLLVVMFMVPLMMRRNWCQTLRRGL